MDKLKETNPNATEINPLLDAMTASLNQAKSLFPIMAATVQQLK